MTKRTGIPSMMRLALKLCKLLTIFTPIIQKLYAENTTLMAALAAANSACHTLYEELAKVRETGS